VVAVPEAHVMMHAAAGVALVPLRHERDGEALLVRDLLRRVLVEDVPVGLLEHLAVAQVDLLLARAPFALARFHRDAAPVERPHDRADYRLFPRALEDVVVLDVRPERLQVVVALLARRVVAVPEEVELDLGAALRDEPLRERPRRLPREDPARRDLDG